MATNTQDLPTGPRIYDRPERAHDKGALTFLLLLAVIVVAAIIAALLL
ncbi:hypothetical protein [Sandaracinus amylolyticus]|nr:hypothetical protein [Sandaracinus amylolyticus]UJR83932.1 Hypothetical protein I5071_60030 [Sandaracinus amylolyticus]